MQGVVNFIEVIHNDLFEEKTREIVFTKNHVSNI